MEIDYITSRKAGQEATPKGRRKKRPAAEKGNRCRLLRPERFGK